MPPEVDQDLAQLYAAMIAQQTTPTYDDGASLLQRNPAMMDVGLFGKPKPKPVAPPVDIQRRKLFGLSDMPAAPVPAPMPMQPPASSMVYKALTAPMSRRDFLGHTARAAGNMALRGALPELGALAETQTPLTEAAKAVGETIVAPDYSLVNATLKDAISTHIGEMSEGDDLSTVYGILRGFVDESKFKRSELKKLDKLSDLYDAGNYDAAVQLEQALDKMVDNLRPGSALDALDDVYSHYSGGYSDLDISDIVNILKNDEDISNEQIHDYLDTHHPGYDQEAVDKLIQDLEG